MGKKKTTLVRVYTDDRDFVKLRFPKVTSADFYHISIRSNPFLQVEAALRKDVQKIKKK